MTAHRVAPVLLRFACLAGLVALGFVAASKASAQGVGKQKATGEVRSRDGTPIAFDKWGRGPALVLVGGALSDRAGAAELAQLLAARFTVYSYDRRGRGDSGNTQPYAVQREIEDIEALIDDAGGSAFVYGKSSGAALALQAASVLGGKVRKLALYEAPYNEAPGAAAQWKEFRLKLDGLLAADQRAEAISLFMKFVGAPEEMIAKMKASPAWAGMLAMAPTLAHDNAVLGSERLVPVAMAATVKASTLVMDGGASAGPMPFMRPTADTIAKAIPGAQRRTVAGQAHDASAKVLAPILMQFFG